MQLVTKKIIDLLPSSYNPRKISEEEMNKLKKSIQTFGYVEPIIWNEKSNRVVGGHQRLEALKQLGISEEIGVVVVNLEEPQEKALNIALNKIHGEWDLPKLKDLLEEFSDIENFDFELTGFDPKEADKLIKKFYTPEFDGKIPEGEENTDLFTHSSKSHIKMVQLFFNEKTHPLFMDKINKLAGIFSTTNVTDTVEAAIDDCLKGKTNSK